MDKCAHIVEEQGVLALVRMQEENKTKVTQVQIAKLGLLDCYEPVPDLSSPNPEQIDKIVEFISLSLASGRPLGVCGAGLGRTVTILACYLVSQGYTGEAAIDELRKKRPSSIETKSQEDAVKAYAKLGG